VRIIARTPAGTGHDIMRDLLSRVSISSLFRPLKKLQSQPFQVVFCVLCSTAALLIALYMTRRGISISWDSTAYINTARNLYHGSWFVSAGNQLFNLWAPLYPMMIAGLMHLGISADQAAKILPVLAYALTVFPMFLLCKAMTKSVTACYAVCLVYLAFAPMLWMSTWALTDIICIFFSMTTMLLLVLFVQSRHKATMLLVLAGLFASLASLTRFMGATIIIVGLVAILVRNTKSTVWSQQSKATAIVIKVRDTITQTLLWFSIGLLPLLVWQLYRPRPHNLGGPAIGTNVYRLLHATLVDFLSSPPKGVAYALAAATIVSLTLLIARGKPLRYFYRNLLPISYVLIYSVCLVIIESVESTEPINTRYASPIYPFILLMAVPLILSMYKRVKRTWIRPVVLSTSIVLVTLFMWFQAGSLNSYADGHGYRQSGGYNTLAWEQDSGIEWINSHIPANAVIYSNCIEPLQWKLDRIVYLLPPSWDEDAIKSFFANLPTGRDTFIISQDTPGIPRMSTAQVDEANAQYNILQVVAEFPLSKIWRVK